MATNYPSSADDSSTLPNPSVSNPTNSPSLSAGQSNQNDAIKAIEAKLGTGASTPTANTLMFGTGTGTSAWTAVTSSQLRSSISDETGTGSAVFATTPTLITPKVDTINESTPANGVTIDSLNIKDGALNTSNSVVTSSITDGAVTPAKLQSGTGSSWAWQTWTPTWSNFTVGNGTVTAKYVQIGKTVILYLKVVLGTTSSMGSSPTFTLPAAATANYTANQDKIWNLQIEDTGVQSYFGTSNFVSTTSASIVVYNASSTYLGNTGVTATIPMTWGTGDSFSLSGFYEAA